MLSLISLFCASTKNSPEAYSLFGRPLYPLPVSGLQNESLQVSFLQESVAVYPVPFLLKVQLQMAQGALGRDACSSVMDHDPDKLVWVGRRTAYLYQYKEAINVYTNAISHHADYAPLVRAIQTHYRHTRARAHYTHLIAQ
jgi:hypothetical protein